MTMNLQMWLYAMRRGKYKQTNRSMRISGGRYSPLGVLCDAYRRATGRGDWRANRLGDDDFYYRFVIDDGSGGGEVDGRRFFPSSEVLSWVGMNEQMMDAIERLSDDNYYGFVEIADTIEAAAAIGAMDEAKRIANETGE